MRSIIFSFISSLLLIVGVSPSLAQHMNGSQLVTPDEIREGLTPDGSRWVTFGGDYNNHRHSPLTQVTPENVDQLVPQWTFQTNVLEKFETTTLFRDNVLYVTCLLYTSDAADE